ncbi:uncharacterized protein CEXT_168191 [Caerostris extrusa]|uniref:Transposase IS30-like HTH domain-containing protein n=1 Tax=Caerostris extrusa TaxID=172846 RepID=A0AAV4W2H6_CAEEX|nr:uncharacterized protein CEXT_168191 [Caerostris extrusa]
MNLKGKEITPEERKIILKFKNEGKTLREIGKIVGRTHSSIQRVINNYTSSKSTISKPCSGRPSKLTGREKRYVFNSLPLTSILRNFSYLVDEVILNEEILDNSKQMIADSKKILKRTEH